MYNVLQWQSLDLFPCFSISGSLKTLPLVGTAEDHKTQTAES